MRLQSEVIIWHPVALQVWPDVDITVLICAKDGDLTLGSWDDEHDAWWDENGEPIDALYWAHVEGPAEL